MATTREVFETNTFGVMAMTQAVLPAFRTRRAGVVVNVTSSVTLAPMPLAAVYTASKMAIEGFTASLALELEFFNVRVKLVEPGYGPTTRFTSNGGSRMEGLIPDAYAEFAQPIFAAFAQPSAVTTELDVADAVWRATNDASGQLRFPSGGRCDGAGPADLARGACGRGRRTALTFPLFPPPQKKRSRPSDSSPDTLMP